jgi:peptidoglycan hydrolase FlgJ
MEIRLPAVASSEALLQARQGPDIEPPEPPGDDPALRAAFRDFVGGTFFSQMLSAMRKTVDKPAYLHGGRAEEVFQNQLDQVLAEHLSEAGAETFVEPMYQLFSLTRR